MTMSIPTATLSLFSSPPRLSVQQLRSVPSLSFPHHPSFRSGSKPAGNGGLSSRRTMHRDEMRTSVNATSNPEFSPKENNYHSRGTDGTATIEFSFCEPVANTVPLGWTDYDDYSLWTIEHNCHPHETTTTEANLRDRLESLALMMIALKDQGVHVTEGKLIAKDSIFEVALVVKQSGHKWVGVEYIQSIITSILLKRPHYPRMHAPKSELREAKATFTNETKMKSLWSIEKTGPTHEVLLKIIQMIKRHEVDVTLLEFNNQGPLPKYKFHLTHKGVALDTSLQRALTNDFSKDFPSSATE